MKRVNCMLLVFVFILAGWCTISAEEATTSEDYTALFPAPLKGWEASEVTVVETEREMDLDINTLFGAEPKKRLVLGRTYSEKRKQGATVTIVIDTWNDDLNSVVPITPEDKKKREELIPDMKPFTYQSYNGLKCYKDTRLKQIILLIDFSQGFGIGIPSDNVEDESIFMKYLERSDLQKIHAFMKQH